MEQHFSFFPIIHNLACCCCWVTLFCLPHQLLWSSGVCAPHSFGLLVVPQELGDVKYLLSPQDLMAVDKHYGRLSDLQNLSRRLHGQGMYLVQDIVVNHMGNYFAYDPEQWNAQNPALGYRREPATAQGPMPMQKPFNRNDARDPDQAREAIYGVRRGDAYFDAAREIQHKHGSRKAGLPPTAKPRARRKARPAQTTFEF